MARAKWDTTDVASSVVRANELLKRHGTDLVELLASGEQESMNADCARMSEAHRGQGAAKSVAKGLTVSQDEALEDGASQVSAWRFALRNSHPDEKAVLKQFGVGTRVAGNSVKSLTSAMQTLLAAAAANPGAARTAAITPSAVERLKATLAALLGLDEAQIAAQEASKQPKKERVEAQVRVERALMRIAAAGTMRFMGTPVADEFAALLPSRGAKKPQTKPAKETPA